MLLWVRDGIVWEKQIYNTQGWSHSSTVWNHNNRQHLTLCVLKVVPPEWPDLVLATDIPHSEANVLVLNCLHIETYKTSDK